MKAKALASCEVEKEDQAQKPWRIVHSLLDVAVDDYLPALDVIGEVIDELERIFLKHYESSRQS